MPKKKMARIRELRTFPNVYHTNTYANPDLLDERGQIVNMKGRWREEFFKNDNPITLELACGKGDYALGLARMYPDKNFIGLDIKGVRLWKGAKNAIDEKLENVAFVRVAIEHIEKIFAPGEVEEIWITFPDPFPKKRQRKRRLTTPKMLKRYSKVLVNNGLIHLKTDSSLLFEYSLESIVGCGCSVDELWFDIYCREGMDPEVVGIQTFYEKNHIAEGRSIKYVSFRLPDYGDH